MSPFVSGHHGLPESLNQLTAAGAVELARPTPAEAVVYAPSVWKGVGGLSPDAGPPCKLLANLRSLPALAADLRAGRVRGPLVGWFRKRKLSAAEYNWNKPRRVDRERCVWHDGLDWRPFGLHLRVNEHTTPALCVRVHFRWCKVRKVVVAWIGRHR